jgi:hypothetical protein
MCCSINYGCKELCGTDTSNVKTLTLPEEGEKSFLSLTPDLDVQHWRDCRNVPDLHTENSFWITTLQIREMVPRHLT